MKPKLSLPALVLAVILALAGWMGSSLSASKAAAAAIIARSPVVITFTMPSSFAMDVPFTVTGFIRIPNGTPVANINIRFSMDGNYLGQELSAQDGSFKRRFIGLDAGNEYDLGLHNRHALPGTNNRPNDRGYSSSRCTGSDRAGDFRCAIRIGRATRLSGEDGVADFQVTSAGKYQLTALVNEFNSPDQRIEFACWLDETPTPYRVIQVPTSNTIQIGLNVYNQVGQTFVDLNGFAVPATRVQQFAIRSAQGDVFALKDGKPQWIPASRVVRFQNGLAPTPLLYSVTSLMVDGSNVVNKSQQQFYAHPNDTWKISLILYTLSVRANDGLFGSTVGKSVNLVYPDGHAETYTFDKNGAVVIHGLARGNYTVQVLDAKGLRQVIPVALSHSQTVDIRVPTSFDILVVLAFGLLAVIGLLLFGRRKQFFGSWIRHNRPAHPQVQKALVKSEELQTVEEKAQPNNNGIIKWY